MTGQNLFERSYMNCKSNISYFMHEAMKLAYQAAKINEVPVGAVIVKNNEIIGSGYNQVIKHKSVASHAEIIAINKASQVLNNYRLKDCDIFVTLEPCHMCAKAIVDSRINHLYFGASEPKTGAIISIDQFLLRTDLNHKVTFSSGLMANESSQLLRSFFLSKRRK